MISGQQFGFLKVPMQGAFPGAEIKLLENHQEKVDWFKQCSNIDGFFYPPQVTTYKSDPRNPELQERVSRSERPATVFHLPASHEIFMSQSLGRFDSVSLDEALIVYLLSFIYGTRLQFSQWKFDSRVPEKPTNNIHISNQTCLHFLEHSYRWWQSISDENRKKFVNILYFFARARTLEWEWDSFVHQYMVFDAIYSIHKSIKPHKNVGHRERFDRLLSDYDIPADNALIDRIYKARNDIFHEALWAGSTIGFGSTQQETFQLPRQLAKLNERLICSMMGYKNEFTGTVWWAMGTFAFDRPR